MRRIDGLFLKYPFYGSRQLVRQLRREYIRVGCHRVRRLMRLMGLEAIYQAPRTSEPHPAHRIYPYLLRGFATDRPNQVWRADITYIPVGDGFLYGYDGQGFLPPGSTTATEYDKQGSGSMIRQRNTP